MNAAKRAVAVAAGATAMICALAVPSRAETDIGGLVAVFTGTHSGADNPTPVYGIVPGALLEASQIWPRVRIHVEGIPQIGLSATTAGEVGTSTASLSLVNAEALVDLDKHQRFRIGGGIQIVNLSNFNGNNGDRNEVRVSSPLFTAVSDLPAGRKRSVELTLRVAPNVTGVLRIYTLGGGTRPDKPEQGAEIDYGAAYAWHYSGATYLLGFRGLSYHTKNTNNDELVDRNVGGGITFEARYRFGRK